MALPLVGPNWPVRMQIKWYWRFVRDDDVGVVFFISPFFGSLHTLPTSQLTKCATLPVWTRLLGCLPDFRRSDPWNYEHIEPPTATVPAGIVVPRQMVWATLIREQLVKWPLILVLNAIEKRASRQARSSMHPALQSDLLTRLNSAWRFSYEPECLPRALFRYKWLRMRGLHPDFVLGVHVPTDRMHAWVAIDGCALGEEPDQLLCYQGLVSFSSVF